VTGDICTESIVKIFDGRFGLSSAGVKSGLVATLFALAGGLAACHGNRAWHDTPATQASISKPTPNECNISEGEADGLNGDPGRDVHAQQNYTSAISRMLKEQKFEALDCLADRARSSKERFAGGTWKLHQLYKGLYQPVQYPVTHATEDDWDDLLRQLQEWTSARPISVTAKVALSRAYLEYARYARGEGEPSTVSESAWKLFHDRTAAAAQILKRAYALRPRCPEWYVSELEVAENQNWDAARKRRLFEEAFKFEPDYYYSGGIYVSGLLPKNGGRVGDAEKFLQQFADRLGREGDIYYFRAAETPNLICGCDQDDKDSHFSWQRIKRGFEESEKQYGLSLADLNRTTFLAAHYGKLDAVFAEKAFARIGEQWDEEIWRRREDFELAQQWAVQWAPAMAKQEALEAEAELNLGTPEGSRYGGLFAGKLKELMQQCALTQGPTTGTLEALINVGTNGTIESTTVYGPGGFCVYQKLLSLQGSRARVLPPPPRDPYWVKLELDWTELSTRLEK
jgi:hypothetical protein